MPKKSSGFKNYLAYFLSSSPKNKESTPKKIPYFRKWNFPALMLK